MYSHRLYWINVSKRAKTDFYRPQRSSGKIMFLHLSVSHFVQGGGLPLVPGVGGGTDTALGRHPPGQTLPLGRQPPGQTPPWVDTPFPVHAGIHPLHSACWDMVNKRAVHILLECILIKQNFWRTSVLFVLGFKARVDSSLGYFVTYVQWIPQIHLWCDTC